MYAELLTKKTVAVSESPFYTGLDNSLFRKFEDIHLGHVSGFVSVAILI